MPDNNSVEICDVEYCILGALRRKPLNIYQLSKATDYEKAQVKHWIHNLLSKNLIRRREDGEHVTYSLLRGNIHFLNGVLLARIGDGIIVYAKEGSRTLKLFDKVLKMMERMGK